MRLTSVVLTSWISSITSKISWIVGWPWPNHVCVCVWVSVCNWFYNLIHGSQKRILVLFVWKFGFWPGEVMEKSWNFFLRFLHCWDHQQSWYWKHGVKGPCLPLGGILITCATSIWRNGRKNVFSKQFIQTDNFWSAKFWLEVPPNL